MSDAVIQLTPPGRSAIATLLIEGPNALRLVQLAFRSALPRPLLTTAPDRLQTIAPDRLSFGYFGPEPGEPVVVRVRSKDSVELHCHGGQAAIACLRENLVSQGCRGIDWREWVENRSDDPVRTAALIALAEARTERTAAILLDQYCGALSQAIVSVGDLLARNDAESAANRLQALLAYANTGLHLARPWRVVVAGPPNAGKSTLINALVGYARAIVDPRPGTTRDLVTAVTAVDGWLVEFCDTAGLRAATDPVEQAGIEAASRALGEADLVILVFDLSQSWSADDGSRTAAYPRAIVVHNKADLAAAVESHRPPGLRLSALRSQGIEELLDAISLALVPQPPEPGEAVPFTAEQAERILQAAKAAEHGDCRGAARLLGPLVSPSEEVANRLGE